MASIYLRGSVWYIKYRRGGRWLYQSLHTKEAKEAESKKAEIEKALLKERMAGLPVRAAPSDLRVAKLRKKWNAWAEANRRPQTIDAVRRAWDAFLKVNPHVKTISQVGPEEIEDFKQARLKDVSPRTVNEHLAELRSTVYRAKREGWYERENPFARVEMLREEKALPRWLDRKQIAAVMAVAEAHSRDMHLVFALGIYGGFRKEEMDRATWGWFHFYDAPRRGVHGLVHIEGSKGTRSAVKRLRTVPMSETLARVLRAHQRPSGYVVRPKNGTFSGRYRFDLRVPFRDVVKAAGVDWATPHTLRHTFASRLAMEGVSLYKIGQWLGHSDPKTTQIYAHLQADDPEIGLV